jgi:hypothetical protein
LKTGFKEGTFFGSKEKAFGFALKTNIPYDVKKRVAEISFGRGKPVGKTEIDDLLKQYGKEGSLLKVDISKSKGRSEVYRITNTNNDIWINPKIKIPLQKLDVITAPNSLKYRTEKITKTKPKASIFDVVEKPVITNFYETGGAGLGKGKGFIERTKQKEFVSVGSKDLDRILEGLGLAPKRKLSPQKSAYDTSDYLITGTGSGKARSLSESQKKNIEMSFGEKTAKEMSDAEMKITGKMSGYEKKNYYKSIAKQRRKSLDKAFPNIIQPFQPSEIKTDYLTSKSVYKPKESSYQSSKFDVEIETLRYPEVVKPHLGFNVKPLTASRTQSRVQQKEKQDMVTVLKTKQIERLKLNTDLVSRTKLRERQVTKQIPKLKTVTMLKSIPILKPMQAAALKQPQLSKQKQKTVQLLKQTRIPKTPRDPEKGRIRRAPPIVWWDKEYKQKKEKSKGKEKADFLGAVPEASLVGVFKRAEITYGQKKIAKLLKGDVRVVAGKPRAVRTSKKQKDILGFNKKKTKTNFW